MMVLLKHINQQQTVSFLSEDLLETAAFVPLADAGLKLDAHEDSVEFS